jgi:hypothetical protein
MKPDAMWNRLWRKTVRVPSQVIKLRELAGPSRRRILYIAKREANLNKDRATTHLLARSIAFDLVCIGAVYVSLAVPFTLGSILLPSLTRFEGWVGVLVFSVVTIGYIITAELQVWYKTLPVVGFRKGDGRIVLYTGQGELEVELAAIRAFKKALGRTLDYGTTLCIYRLEYVADAENSDVRGNSCQLLNLTPLSRSERKDLCSILGEHQSATEG